MKIFFPIGAYYPSQVGGPCNTVYWHACALKRNHFQVKVFTTKHGIVDGIIPYDVDVENESGMVYYHSGKVLSLKVVQKIRDGIYWSDVVHLNSLFHHYSIISFLLLLLFYRDKKVVWSVRGELNTKALAFSGFKKRILLYVYKKLDLNVIFHGTSQKEINEIGMILPKSKNILLPNFIHVRESFNVKTKKQLLFIGRINPIKSIHKLIEAVAMSKSFKGLEFKLVIAGSVNVRYQTYKNELDELVEKLNLKNKIEFVGHIEGYRKELLYAESYMLILPSETENFGNVVVESLTQGTPVIASLGTPWQILEEFKCGLHVSNSPFDLAMAIDRIISLSSDEYSNWRNNAKELVKVKFNINSQIYQWIGLYNNLYVGS